MNTILLVGRIVYEPELKQSKNGNFYLTTKIAVDRHDKDKNTDFISCRAWGKTAEFIDKYFHKGDPIEVSGRLQSESYEKDGQKVEGMIVVISEVGFVPRSAGKAEPKKESDDGGLPFEV